MRRWTAGAKSGLALILIVAAVVLMDRGLRQGVDYDSLWHVFIVRQDSWRGFWQEVQGNSHPPLYYLLLKASLSLPISPPLAYRTVSIAAVLVSTLLFAAIARRITRNQPLAIVAAAAFGLSLTVNNIGLGARAYALGGALLLVSFSTYLDWLGSRPARFPIWKRIVFAGALTAALLTHYATFFFLAATVMAPLLLARFHVRWRVRLLREVQCRPVHLLLMFGIPVATAALEYVVHARSAVVFNGHVTDFVYDHGRESALAFLARTTTRLTHFFSPAVGGDSIAAAAVVAASVGGFAMVAALRSFRGRLAAVPIVVVGAMWLLNVVAALMGRYPYGSAPHHEFHLFVFGLLALFAAIEHARRALPSASSSRHLWTTVALMAVAANFGLWFSTLPMTSERVMQRQMHRFREVIGSPPVILVDQYNLIMLFGHHDVAEWRLIHQDGRAPWQVWSVTQGARRFAVCRSRQWQIDLSHPRSYAEVARCLALTRADRVAVFRPQQRGVAPSWDTKAARELATTWARESGLLVEAIAIEGDDVYASFGLPPSRL